MNSFKVIISGGGTGGHIYPAIAIAKEILIERKNAEILFVGANGRMEMEKIPEHGFNIVGLNIVGIQRSLSLTSIIKNLKFPFLLLKSFNDAKKVLLDFKPNVVIGVGGYASGPTLRMAHQIGIPTLIQEQNSFAGLTNKWLSKKTKRICVAYNKMEQFFDPKKLVLTGNPVRKDIQDLTSKKEEAKSYFNIQKKQKVILVLGGSLGAKSINDGIKKSLHLLSSMNVHLIWQVGKRYYSEIESWLKKNYLDNIQAMAFVNRMDLAYSISDVVISRAGALSISELTLAGKPSILVPSPNVSEDHQTKNAMSLVNHSAAILVKDNQTEQLISKAISLLKDQELIASLSKNAKSLGKPNASKDIVKEIFKISLDER
ncbi:MAG: undecaprenyldiphospho-muramoylpentapeptide beta-N-acetylglucosaminyltransferase [Crocinitomicaceae bacterium]|nr:undecaprenyldiphospho-muramoylpentapeptide beta-N-acetylglucosaminyltransferase [Crocinitomicaceae bacterium]MAW83470.1 undecaprenyldiphospho-muramoylpentapeptide beta-N-acetylglucosaminyltransferase [Crocinitomicaceae bacterium]|tara:strand:- start:2140 stop:3258 length:1119 start_codon:yes stop_codon:yes gene_type:complete